MKYILYSKLVMKKFGKDIHQAKLNCGFTKKFIMWCINSKYRKSVRLHKWLKEQVENAPSHIKSLALYLKGSNNDITIINILKWVHKYIKYKSDNVVWDMNEYWQTANETIIKSTGDCEDGTVLIYILARLAGIPEYQILCACGDVVGGGHAYCIYSADYDGIDKIIDWCYWYDSIGIVKRKYAYTDKRYIKEWFRFNENGTYFIKDITR